MASEKSSVKPAAERSIAGGAVGRGAQRQDARAGGLEEPRAHARAAAFPSTCERRSRASSRDASIAMSSRRRHCAAKRWASWRPSSKKSPPRLARDARGADAAGRALLGDRARAVRDSLPRVGKEARRSAGPTPEPNFDQRTRSLRARAQRLQELRVVRPRALCRRLLGHRAG